MSVKSACGKQTPAAESEHQLGPSEQFAGARGLLKRGCVLRRMPPFEDDGTLTAGGTVRVCEQITGKVPDGFKAPIETTALLAAH